MSTHIFGIRHHGPGSARSLRRAMEEMQPDIVLVEGPPDAADVLPLLVHPDMQPPVALLVYRPEQPQQAVFYPFAVFSPEWQALHFALSHQMTARFMDLPQAHMLAAIAAEPPEPAADQPDEIQQDPLRWLAEAAGYSDSERWWEHMVEQRVESSGIFAAILEAITALRQTAPPSAHPLEAQREAYMRQTIRAAEREGFKRIAVVCGAWHAPALAIMPPAGNDAAILKRLPRVKVEATWVPWTYSRLSSLSGYGAGIESPGWYHHLWTAGDQVAVRWLARVAELLRGEGMDTSVAHVIEAVRLAETLASLRGRPLPGLPELNEAVQATLCFGSDMPLRVIHDKLIVGERLGQVPAEAPMVPLQRDLQAEQKRLRLPMDAGQRLLDLDLRQATDLQRSHLLHRLRLLSISWGEIQKVTGKSGTFHELWQISWQPAFSVAVIEAATWGNTVEAAASGCACDAAEKATDLPALTNWLERALLADLADAIGRVMTRLQAEAAIASDVAHLMDALPPLANVLRYGSVRQTDSDLVGQIVDGLVARLCIGLPGACAALDDDAAGEMVARLDRVHGAIMLLQNPQHQTSWYAALQNVANQDESRTSSVHGVVAGRCCRMLLDVGALSPEDAARYMGLALSAANAPAQAGAWIEGFLSGSGLLLLHNDRLWQVLNEWVIGLGEQTFTNLLPLLRRTFAAFPAGERRQMGERVRRSLAAPGPAAAPTTSQDEADIGLDILNQLLGTKSET
jgi:hypothetical protein